MLLHVATSLPGVYENVEPLSQITVKTYENITTVSCLPHHQSNIEMKQCTAYGVLTDF